MIIRHLPLLTMDLRNNVFQPCELVPPSPDPPVFGAAKPSDF